MHYASHLDKPLPHDSKEMIAFISYFKWMNDSSEITRSTPGIKNLQIEFPAVAASPVEGEKLFIANCSRCHGKDGEGIMQDNNETPTWRKGTVPSVDASVRLPFIRIN